MLIAMELLVGRPKTWLTTGEVTPSARPIEVLANAPTATDANNDRREIGCFIQAFRRIFDCSLMYKR